MARRRISRTRRVSAYARRPGHREPRSTTLIVCEGETEEAYFRALRAHLGLTAAEVIIADNTKGSAPISVVQYAEQRVREQGGYDHVYCVFDRDDHASYGRALERIARLSGRAARRLNISAVASRPCFEIWVLLHFEKTDRPFENCDEVVARIRRAHIPAYRKADGVVLKMLLARTGEALENADWLAAQGAITGDNPGTTVHMLARHLKNASEGKFGL